MKGGASGLSMRRSLRNPLSQAALALIGFYVLSLLGRWVYAFFGLAVLAGIALPLAWAARTGQWAAGGLSWPVGNRAWWWGIAGGVATGLIGLAVLPQRTMPRQLGLQLALGVPMWALVASPFQELFFRGWIQPRFEAALGPGWGLLFSTVCFWGWHYVAPFAEVAAVPLWTPLGAAATLAAGLIYGLCFQRGRSVISPWLAHTISGITFVAVGAMDLLPPG